MKKFFHAIFHKTWNPYFAGIFIGFLQLPAFIFIGKTLGSGTAYSMLTDFFIRMTGLYHADTSPSIANTTRFSNIHNWWYVPLLIGVAIGAFASSRFGKENRVDKKQAIPIANGWAFFGLHNKTIQIFFSFLGGFFLLLGTRIASGCASGHGLSGIAKLQISSVITITFMFIFAIITVNAIIKVHKKLAGKHNE